jgi:hypothetical protein
VEVVVTRFYQFNYVFHLNVVVANDAKFLLRHLTLQHALVHHTVLEDVLSGPDLVNLVVLRLVELRGLYSFDFLNMLIVQVGRVPFVLFTVAAVFN